MERRKSTGAKLKQVEAYYVITGKEELQSKRFIELAPNKATWRHR